MRERVLIALSLFVTACASSARGRATSTPVQIESLNAFLDEVVPAFTTPPAPVPERDERPLPAVLVDSTYTMLAGVWDWKGGDDECKSGTHTLTASPDRRELLLDYPDRKDSPGAPDRVRYRIVEAGPQILAWVPHAIRLEMEGEEMTKAIIRCDAPSRR